jgi:cell division inhibitor SepF
MATLWRRAMVYLGLVDDDDYEYEPYDEPQPPTTRVQRPAAASMSTPAMIEPEPVHAAIRTLPREEPAPIVQPRPAVVRPIMPMQSAKVHVVAPSVFSDVQEIGDKVKSSQPVIVNLQGVERGLSRRIIDFSSGLAYAVGGQMDRVADQVFLLTPSNVEVSAEEKRRLQERGLYHA